MRTCAILAPVATSALLAAASVATATEAASDPERAASRFEEAKNAMGRGDFADACPKLAESEVLDPQVGTLMNLAYCYENVGKTATALSTWMEAASFAAAKQQQEREQFALLRAHWLEPHLLRVTIRVAPQPSYDRIALTLAGAPFDRSRWGVPVPMDRGDYDLHADAPGVTGWSTHFTVDEGHVPTVVVPALAPIEPSGAQTTHRPPSPLDTRLSATTSHSDAAVGTSRPHLMPFAIAAGAVGMAALAVGSGFGIAALINASAASANANCTAGGCSTHDSENRRATHDATAADASLVVAAVAGAAGLALWLIAGSGHAPPGHVSIQAGAVPGLATVTVSGRW